MPVILGLVLTPDNCQNDSKSTVLYSFLKKEDSLYQNIMFLFNSLKIISDTPKSKINMTEFE